MAREAWEQQHPAPRRIPNTDHMSMAELYRYYKGLDMLDYFFTYICPRPD
jgi:hypothetical protein